MNTETLLDFCKYFYLKVKEDINKKKDERKKEIF